MEKQKADRKRRQVEMKKREKEANEKRQRLLNDLDKRQKEARKKTIPEGMGDTFIIVNRGLTPLAIKLKSSNSVATVLSPRMSWPLT